MSTVKAPTRAARAATNASAAAFSSHQSLSSIVRMLAGHADAKQDVLAGVVYSAYYQALRHGNKAQLQGRENSLFEQATMYSKQANAKAAGFAQPKKAADYYAAHLCALEGVGIPDRMPAAVNDAEGYAAAVTAKAEGMALAYMDMVDAYLADIAAAAADKRAAAKAAKDAAPKQVNSAAADAVADAVKAAAADQASAAPAVPALADMVAAVAAALVAGALTVEQHNALADAIEMANTLAVSAALAAAAQAEEAERVNADAEEVAA